jgi:hypothetical protein
MVYSKVKVEKIVGEQPGPQDVKLVFLEEGGLCTHLPTITVSIRPGEKNDFVVGDELRLVLEREGTAEESLSEEGKASGKRSGKAAVSAA